MILTFGRREIVMTPCLLENDLACMLLNKTEPHREDEIIETKRKWVEYPDVRLEFETEESLNQLIAKLELLRDFMNGDFHNLDMVDIGEL